MHWLRHDQDERIETFNRDLKEDLKGVGQDQGVGQELKGVGKTLPGRGQIATSEVTSVKEDVSKVGQDAQESSRPFPT